MVYIAKQIKINFMNNKLKALSIFVIAAIMMACSNEKKETPAVEALDLANMDTTVKPQNDFYQYVNGSWIDNAKIPDDRTRWGGFMILRKKTDDDVLKILKKAEKSGKYADNTDQGKALAVFNTIMDTVSRNETGLMPLEKSLEKIEAISNVADLESALAKNPSELSSPFFGLFVYSDPDNSDINKSYISTGGLGLPERDYYLKDDKKSKETREKYKEYITTMLQYINIEEADAKNQAERILALETRLAKPRLSKEEKRNFNNYNNRYALEDVKSEIASIDWKRYMTNLGVEKLPDTVLVTQPKYFRELDKMFDEANVEDWKMLMRWHTLNDAAGQLTTELGKKKWAFYSKYLRGAKKQRPLDERALSSVNGSIGEAVGQLYVDEKFPPEAKQKAEAMIDNVILAFKNRINKLEWMTDSTKAKAIEKLDKFTVKIGYPDEFKDYSDLDVSPDKSYYENMLAVSEWNFRDDLKKIGKPVDKTEWGMSPQTVNAYFNPLFNEIVFPAAILQPPFYNYKADAAVNYGGIGAVIGHEISHAFDDSGARFDANGNLKNWWTDKDKKEFEKRGNQLAEFYSNIKVLDTLPINGKFTLGENIGDLGGVLGAYDGLQMHYEDNGRPHKTQGFTPEQRFFMSWATVWRTKIRDEALRTQIQTDPHSPGQIRGYAPLQHVDSFYDVFDVKPEHDLYIAPEERVRIW
jgi:putative endopeptidase